MTDIQDAEIVEQVDQVDQVETRQYTQQEEGIRRDIDGVRANFEKDETRYMASATLMGIDEDEFNKYREIYEKPELFEPTATAMVKMQTYNQLISFCEATGQQLPPFMSWENLADPDTEKTIEGLRKFGIGVMEQYLHSANPQQTEVLKMYSMKFRSGGFMTDVDGEFRSGDLALFAIGAVSIVMINQLPHEARAIDRVLRTTAAALSFDDYAHLEKARELAIAKLNREETEEVVAAGDAAEEASTQSEEVAANE